MRGQIYACTVDGCKPDAVEAQARGAAHIRIAIGGVLAATCWARSEHRRGEVHQINDESSCICSLLRYNDYWG